MARIIPSGWRELRATGAAERELETLALLADALPDSCTVYHGVHWTQIEHGLSAFGEIDFIIVAPSGRMLVIEQKSGVLEEGSAGMAQDLQRDSAARRVRQTASGRLPSAYRNQKFNY